MKRTKTSRATDEDLPVSSSSWRYVESSVLIAAILERDAEAAAQISEIGRRATSTLTLAEGTRALVRARASGRLTPREERAALTVLRRFINRSLVIAISDEILARSARAFPVEPVRTLDAIHLATLESLGEVPPLVTVITRDTRIARNALALGYAVA